MTESFKEMLRGHREDEERRAADKTERYDQLYIGIAARCSEMSHSKKRKVGCVIVKDETMVSHGWNGMPTGYHNDCEYPDPDPDTGRLIARPEVLHAEENALGKLAGSTLSAKGGDLYVTYEPCIRCAKLIWRSGIRRVFYSERQYEGSLHKSGVPLLDEVGVETVYTPLLK